MERLTFVKCPKCWNTGRHPTPYSSRKTFQEVVARLAYYENMEEQGRLVVLPCKAGDTVYEIDAPEYGVIVCKVLHITVATDFITKEPVSVVTVEVIEGHGVGSCYDFEADDFGKTIFLTREEAEQALKGGVEE